MSCTAPIANISVRNKVIDNCWNWLHDNFHKLNETNKIKVILTICGKNVPQEIKNEGGQRVVQIVYAGNQPKEDNGNRPAEGSASRISEAVSTVQ